MNGQHWQGKDRVIGAGECIDGTKRQTCQWQLALQGSRPDRPTGVGWPKNTNRNRNQNKDVNRAQEQEQENGSQLSVQPLREGHCNRIHMQLPFPICLCAVFSIFRQFEMCSALRKTNSSLKYINNNSKATTTVFFTLSEVFLLTSILFQLKSLPAAVISFSATLSLWTWTLVVLHGLLGTRPLIGTPRGDRSQMWCGCRLLLPG